MAVLLFWSCESTIYVQGKSYYQDLCANCHMDDGSGLNELIPSLAKSTYLQDNQEALPCLLVQGKPDTSFVAMPGFKELSEYEIANIINYINSSWGNKISEQSINVIRERMSDCKP